MDDQENFCAERRSKIHLCLQWSCRKEVDRRMVVQCSLCCRMHFITIHITFQHLKYEATSHSEIKCCEKMKLKRSSQSPKVCWEAKRSRTWWKEHLSNFSACWCKCPSVAQETWMSRGNIHTSKYEQIPMQSVKNLKFKRKNKLELLDGLSEYFYLKVIEKLLLETAVCAKNTYISSAVKSNSSKIENRKF